MGEEFPQVRKRRKGTQAGETGQENARRCERRVGSGSSKGHRLGRRGREQAILPRASVCPLGDGEPSQEKEKGGLGEKVSKGDPNKRGLSPLANNEPKMERRPIFYSWPRRAINYRFLPPSPAPPPSSCHPRLFWAWAWP